MKGYWINTLPTKLFNLRYDSLFLFEKVVNWYPFIERA